LTISHHVSDVGLAKRQRNDCQPLNEASAAFSGSTGLL